MALISSTPLAIGSLLALVIFVVRSLSSPLSKLPGPTTSKFTSIILRWNEIQARRTMYIHDLHLRYGPVVRIAPNEVSFTSWGAVKEIYCSGGSGYDKTEFYDLFMIYGRRTMFTTLNKADHAKRKRILADRYANTNVMRSTSMTGIHERSKTFLKRCTSEGSRASDIFVSLGAEAFVSAATNDIADVLVQRASAVGREVLTQHVALHAYACDCVTHHLFHPNGTDCLRQSADEEMMHQVAADDSLQNRLIYHYSPTLHRLFSSILYLFAKPRQTPLADNYVIETSKRDDAEHFTLSSRLREKNGEIDQVDMAAECLDHMAAGIDTTGDGLCFLMWELSQPRSFKFQHKLQKELRQNRDSPAELLPVLDAVISEGLRCFPPIPMSLPRYVPSGGRTLDGYFVPEGTVVSCQAYSVHRMNHDIFPDPDRFDPDRWLSDQGDSERRRLLFAFSNGGRGCVGKHLALAEMRTLLRDVYSDYSTTPHESMTEESMAMSDQLVSSRPIGQRCLVHFRRIDSETT